MMVVAVRENGMAEPNWRTIEVVEQTAARQPLGPDLEKTIGHLSNSISAGQDQKVSCGSRSAISLGRPFWCIYTAPKISPHRRERGPASPSRPKILPDKENLFFAPIGNSSSSDDIPLRTYTAHGFIQAPRRMGRSGKIEKVQPETSSSRCRCCGAKLSAKSLRPSWAALAGSRALGSHSAFAIESRRYLLLQVEDVEDVDHSH